MAAPLVDRNYHFPPFPPTPPDVQITPFSDFQEWGTRVIGADGVEHDGQGIPTIALAKSKKSKNKKKKAAATTGVKLPWWEEWFTGSGHLARSGVYDLTSNRVDRFHQAGTDFVKFHDVNTREYVKQIWLKFQIFVGLGSDGLKLGNSRNDDDNMSDDAFDDDEASSGPLDDVVVSPAEMFLDDPVQTIKIFLSSYMRSAGLMWDENKLDAAPRLMRFFVEFLLRNEAVPESADGFRESLDVIETAAKELPATPVISKTLPGAFSEACVVCWGSRLQSGWVRESDEEGEPEAKRTKTSLGDEEVLDGAKIEDVPDDEEMKDTTENTSWGASSDAQADSTGEVGWGGGGGWADDTDSWPDGKNPKPNEPEARIRPTLMDLLGPTALPHTHEPGIVEWSLRRLKSITVPDAAQDADGTEGDGAAAVEHRLASRMARIVLAPWLAWDPAHLEASAPHILGTSRGALVGDVNAPGHDMLKDEITLLVDPATLEASKLCVGMGLAATWVQIARVSGADNGGEESGGVGPGQYWYLEEFVLVLPSFWST
ncbi:hypothetical protein FB45DRAFT_796792 [Roridomyces roridus]|uniref:Uncharacterized protein n=1 Tax=Roridomyces roridus TaxID=1738132 RepID=A0AAD7BM21_9AGAR|nr:hypothetical protein FB45DRAFT_796792 [Roridomyces roridus]